jgi:hypothetical protein
MLSWNVSSVVLLLVSAGGAAAQSVGTPVTSAITPSCPPSVELVKALAWPVIAAGIAVLFRKPLQEFVGALGTRITKLSVFKVEFELVPAATAAASPLLDDIRTATTPAAISDSSRAMLEQLQSQTPANFAEINIGIGDEWLTSRLYIAALMLQRMRGVEALVFLERTCTTDRHFVAVVSVNDLRWALAQRYPWLEAAFARAYVASFPWPPSAMGMPPVGAAWLPDPRTMSAAPPFIVSPTGAIESSRARQITATFIESLQSPVMPQLGATLPADDSEWTTFRSATRERALWVTRELLEALVPRDALGLWTDAARDTPRARRTRAVLRRAAPFVAVVDEDRGFTRLVNRRVLLEEIAASLGEEPERAAN